MRLPKLRYVVLLAATLGAAIPLLLMALVSLRILHMLGGWDLFVWPSSFMLMATEEMGHSAGAFGILAYTIGINVVLYVLVFSILWSLAWLIRAWRLSLRDGTTI